MKAACVYWLTGILLSASTLLLDYQGAFIYFTYLPVYLVAVLFLGWVIKLLRTSSLLHQSVLLLPAVLFCVLSVMVPKLPNGERKRFFLVASSIDKGTQEARIRSVMHKYRITENANGSLTFSYRSRPQTEDHFVVVLDPATRTASSVEFLAD